MDVYVRDVDPLVVKKLDELARKKGVSRSKYLRQMFNKAAESEILESAADKYERLVSSVAIALSKNTEALEMIKDRLDEGSLQ